jgi:RHS repeat-associated protein
LDVVRTTVGEIPGAESSVDIAYDENGDRVWYSYSGTGQDRGFTEITVPGVGVYRADRVDGADGEFRLVRMDLVAGGYRDAGGSVHFPVKDAQGNVRGYASTAGLESAYDYYPYGTAVDLSANGSDDSRRWQGKEFDGEHGKYYFGARYFDPFFALWASPDPAGQFANPYSYGGDPVNYVDPSGEIVIAAILAGAAVGAVIGGGTAVYQCNVHGQGDCSGSYVATSAVVGAAAGAAGGLAAGAVSASGIGASIVGEVGLSSHSGFWAAFAGGAMEGGFSGAAAGYANYSLKALMGQTDGWDWKELAKSTLVGMGMGAPIGGLSSGIAYGLSEKFQWKT